MSTSNPSPAAAPFFSTEELRLAWDRVEDNEGCAGSDGVTIERFGDHLDREFSSLQHDLATATYRLLPLLRIMVEKSPGSAKMRAFSYLPSAIASATGTRSIFLSDKPAQYR